jgi:drug/metabolite transporter (DMT)-like permease
MNWILLATFGDFLNAIVAVLDKYIVSDEKALPKPFVYAFYSCLLSSAWVLVYFLGFLPPLASIGVPAFTHLHFPTLEILSMAFLTAYTLFMALVSMYEALRRADASNVMPIIGTISALATFVLSYVFLDVNLSAAHIAGVLLIATGTLFVAKTLPELESVVHTAHSGVFFAFHYITMKGLFTVAGFDDGFFWSRVCFVLFALSLLLVPNNFKIIRSQTKTTSKKTGVLVMVTKVFAGVAAFLILKATDLGEVSVVQALDGVRFVFILFITALFAHWLPASATDRDTRPKTFARKLMYTIVIIAGYFMLFA